MEWSEVDKAMSHSNSKAILIQRATSTPFTAHFSEDRVSGANQMAVTLLIQFQDH